MAVKNPSHYWIISYHGRIQIGKTWLLVLLYCYLHIKNRNVLFHFQNWHKPQNIRIQTNKINIINNGFQFWWFQMMVLDGMCTDCNQMKLHLSIKSIKLRDDSEGLVFIVLILFTNSCCHFLHRPHFTFKMDRSYSERMKDNEMQKHMG